MKYYLLIAGSWYYPSSSTGDWIDTFETSEEAKHKVSAGIGLMGKDAFFIDNREYDWYEIIDLREWINK